VLLYLVQVIREWRRSGGVLLIGYEMYRLLSLSVPSLGGNKMATKRKKSAAQLAAASGATIDLDHNEKEMESLMGGCGDGCG
jgi:RAD54-like protein 2